MAKKPDRPATILHLRCGKCGHTWEERIFQPMKRTAIFTRFQSMLCGNCGVGWMSHTVAPQRFGQPIIKLKDFSDAR